MRVKLCFHVVLCSTFMAACTTAQQSQNLNTNAATMSGEEIKTLLVGNTLRYTGPEAGFQSWTKTQTSYVGDNKVSGKGEWWLEGNKYCTRYAQFNNGKPHCETLLRLEDGRYTRNGSKYKWEKVKEANSTN